MSYLRVIPRDLFNEANLLKCYGKLYLNLENLGSHTAELVHVRTREQFDVRQDQSDGSTTIANVCLMVRGREVPLFRHLNNRGEWPLHAHPDPEEDAFPVFNENGMFSAEMLSFLTNPNWRVDHG